MALLSVEDALQRILHGVDASIGPIVVHGAVAALNDVYRAGAERCREVTAPVLAAAESAIGLPTNS